MAAESLAGFVRALREEALAIFVELDHPDADQVRAKLHGILEG